MRTLLLSLALLAACSSTSKNVESFESKAKPLADGMGRIYVYRKSKMMGGGLRPAVKVNGAVVGKSAPGTYFYFDKAPGEYTMSCSVLMQHSIRFQVKAGETVFVETRSTVGRFAGHIRPGIVTPKEGAAAAAKCKYTDP